MSLKFKSNEQVAAEQERGNQKLFGLFTAFSYVIPVWGAIEVIYTTIKVSRKASGATGKLILHCFISMFYFPLVGVMFPMMEKGAENIIWLLILATVHLLVLFAPFFYVGLLNKITSEAKKAGIESFS